MRVDKMVKTVGNSGRWVARSGLDYSTHLSVPVSVIKFNYSPSWKAFGLPFIYHRSEKICPTVLYHIFGDLSNLLPLALAPTGAYSSIFIIS